MRAIESAASSAGVLGPHGGPFVPLESGLVELSVFETGVPPVFRLYFFDRDKKPMPPMLPDKVRIETIRVGDKRQTFTFRHGFAYLESTTDIPEPHEFTAYVIVSHDGHEHRYETEFTEDGHSDGGHDHGAHSHGDHGHARGTGVLGWLRGNFAHSHSVVDKVDATMESSDRGIWALKISLVGLGVTALLQVIVVLISGSIALLADTIHNFADAATSVPLWVAFALAKRPPNRRFTYGYGKIEDVAGVLIVLIIFFSACVTAYEAAMKIIHPQPMQHLWWVAAAALIGFVGNEAVAIFRIKVGKEIGSAALVADGKHARVDGFTSLSVLIGVVAAWLGFPIIDPLVGVAISIAILFIVKDASIAIWNRLIDGIEPEILAEIEHAPMHIVGVRAVREVRARWMGHKVYGDVTIEVDPLLSVDRADALAKEVEASLRGHIRLLGTAVVRVCPAPETVV